MRKMLSIECKCAGSTGALTLSRLNNYGLKSRPGVKNSIQMDPVRGLGPILSRSCSGGGGGEGGAPGGRGGAAVQTEGGAGGATFSLPLVLFLPLLRSASAAETSARRTKRTRGGGAQRGVGRGGRAP